MSGQNSEKLIFTLEEAEVIKGNLEDLKARLYKTDFKAEDFVNKNFSQELKETLFKGVSFSSANSDIEKAIEGLIKSILSMEPIVAQMSFEPSGDFIQWLKKYLEEQIKGGNGAIIKVEVDRSMILGVMLEFRGKIKSEIKKEEILNVFKISN